MDMNQKERPQQVPLKWSIAAFLSQTQWVGHIIKLESLGQQL